MRKTVFVFSALLLASTQAQARPHHLTRIHHIREAMAMAPGMTMMTSPGMTLASTTASSERVVGGRPAGCPNAFCGCEASLYRFGRVIPELNLASNWRRFPRAAPAPGMAAVRSGHVMILQAQVGNGVWTVHDGNSGGHVTREHARSLAGYTIVDPSGATGTFNFSSQAQAASFGGGDGQAAYPYASRGRRVARAYGDPGQTASYGGFGQAAYTYGSRGRRMARGYGDQGYGYQAQAGGFNPYVQSTYLYAPRGKRIARAHRG